MKINYKKTSDIAIAPFKTHSVDAGFDLSAASIKITNKYVEYGTGIMFETPDGYVGLLAPRSSVTNTYYMLKNAPGILDSSYRGEVRFRFYDTRNIFVKSYHSLRKLVDKKFVNQYIYNIGDKIGQVVFIKLPVVELVETKKLSETARNTGGYGSTGK